LTYDISDELICCKIIVLSQIIFLKKKKGS
jgi:hypothetical protein